MKRKRGENNGIRIKSGPPLNKFPIEHPHHPGNLQDGRAAVAMAENYADGEVIARHFHRRAQLIYASSGLMTVTTASGAWVVPPQRALWIPPGVAHEVKASGDLRMRTLYFEPNTSTELIFPQSCTVIEMTILMRELVLRAVELESGKEDCDRRFKNLLRVLLDETGRPPVLSFHLPLPADPRLAKICGALLADPAVKLTLPMWGKRVGGSARTLGRHFSKETGMTFAQWRQKARLLASLTKLARGETIASVSLDLGYNSPSAFSAMFRKKLGASPASYISGAEREILVL
jgi:AraC-like DNA-binding protein/quercetin dioxygenase-like cupin family protein